LIVLHGIKVITIIRLGFTATESGDAVFSRRILPVPCLVCVAEYTYSASPYQPEVGTASSDGAAGAANPTNTYDASALRTNPAGLTKLSDPETLFVGGQLLTGVMRFKSVVATAGGKDGGNVGPFELLPSVFLQQETE
jgi:hypothetical protein